MIGRKILKISIAILSGGESKRFGKDKAFACIKNTPMIKLVYEKVHPFSDDIIIVIKRKKAIEKYRALFPKKVKIGYDIRDDFNNPIIGAYTCFKAANYKYCLLLACDLPLIKRNIIKILINNINDYDAIIPRHPNGYIEPMHAIYQTKKSIRAIEPFFKNKKNIRMQDFISELENVNYISTDLIREYDKDLDTFLNINTIQDIEKVKKKLRGLE
ncbi:MAG: NTP transferase domain-containing protein [Candidatus Lokiarchaeota archaeon]|nr:NTP transferase domain-containing protein [Candidatus Lokiarchaeota archaeon]